MASSEKLPYPGEEFEVRGESMTLLAYFDEPNTGLAKIQSRGYVLTVPVVLLRAALGVPLLGAGVHPSGLLVDGKPNPAIVEIVREGILDMIGAPDGKDE